MASLKSSGMHLFFLSWLFATSIVAAPNPGQHQATRTKEECDSQGTTAAVKPTVTICDGVLHGTTSLLPSATAVVNQYLGIPFAASPPKRFEPPTAPSSWSSPKQVQNFTAACVQQFNYPDIVRQITIAAFNNPGGPQPAESEDCLYLNVYTPSTPAPDEGRAVLFWIFGGAFQFGTAMQQGYDGSSFAYNQDVIVVVPNYRTNVFGFSGSPHLASRDRNAGLLDQRMALNWVQENIESFGGDPDKVTIFGESAGGASVDRLITTMGGRDGQGAPFRAAILESGQATYGALAADNTNAVAGNWTKLVGLLNCTGSADSEQAYTCVQQTPASVVKNTIERNALVFVPVPDNYTQLSNPRAAYLQGRAAKVPVLQGTNKDEGTVFELAQTNLTTFLDGITDNATERAAIAAAFPRSNYASDYLAISDIYTKLRFTCPQSGLRDTLRQSGFYNGRSWQYFYNASFTNIQPLLKTYGINLGVFHSSEIGLVFGTYPQANATAQEVVLSNYMQTAWANFAKDPVRGPGWNAVGTYNGTDAAVLGAMGSSGATMQPSSVFDGTCGLFSRIIQPIG